MMGLGVSFPILPMLFGGELDFFGSLNKFQLSFLYGLLQASFAIAQFIGAPILGRLSDKYGRKRIMLMSLAGAITGYLLFAYGVYSKNIWFLFAGRLVPGFAGGNISVLYSSLADVSSGKEKLKSFGAAGAGFGLGMVLGPLAGGILSESEYVSWFDFYTPFLFMALLSAINLIVVAYFFRETIQSQQERGDKAKGFQGFLRIKQAFSHPRLKLVFAVVLIHASGFSFFLQFISFYMIERFGIGQSTIGYLFGYVGIWTVITQGVLIRPLANRFPPERVVANVIILFAFGLIALLIPVKLGWLFLLLPLLTIFQGIYMPNMTAIVSNLSDKEIQGEMLGINQSLTAFSNAIPPIIGGYLLSFGTRPPIYIAAACVLVGWVIFNIFYWKLRRGKI